MTAVQTHSVHSCRVEMDGELKECVGKNSVNKCVHQYKFGHKAEVKIEARGQSCRKSIIMFTSYRIHNLL